VADRKLDSSSIFGGLAELGKYFQAISIAPSAVVVLGLYSLFAAGAPRRAPSWSAMVASTSHLRIVEVGALAILIVIVGMTLHPFQRAATQLLEGYWGPTRVGRTAMFSRGRIHLARRLHYTTQAAIFQGDAEYWATIRNTASLSDTIRDAELRHLRAAIDAEAFSVAVERYPTDIHRLRPTRLGNILRRYEDLAGAPYELEAITVTPHLMVTGPPAETQMVDDAGTELDLCVRFVVCWLLFATVSFFLLWPYGIWLLIPLISYSLAWLSYRAAVHAGEEYGITLCALFDLNHSALGERFQLDAFGNTARRDVHRAISRVAGRNEEMKN
jgi:hypothetical protein